MALLSYYYDWVALKIPDSLQDTQYLSDRIIHGGSSVLGWLVAYPGTSLLGWIALNAVLIGIIKSLEYLAWLITWPVLLFLIGFGISRLLIMLARSIVYPGSVKRVMKPFEEMLAKDVLDRLLRSLSEIEGVLIYLAEMQQQDDNTTSIVTNAEGIKRRLDVIKTIHTNNIKPLYEIICAARLDNGGPFFSRGEEFIETLSDLLGVLSEYAVVDYSTILDETKDNDTKIRNFFTITSVKLFGRCNLFSESTSTPVFTGNSSPRNGDLCISHRLAKCCARVRRLSDVLVRSNKPSTMIKKKKTRINNNNNNSHSVSLDIQEKDQEQDEDDTNGVDAEVMRKKPTNVSEFLTLAKVIISDMYSNGGSFDGLASLTFFRAKLQLRFSGKRVMLPSYDGTLLDTMFLPCPKPEVTLKHSPTVLLCNPNGGVYEYLSLHPHWVNFHHERGYHVMVWNYRGYGLSKGSPSPSRCCSDGEFIVKHLESEYAVSKIIVHGESIGGVVACYLGWKTDHIVKVVIADRAFSSLPEVARHYASSIPYAYSAMRYIVQWDADNVKSYLKSANSVSRVITCDPEDNIVANAASLKVGISRTITRLALARKESNDVLSKQARFIIPPSGPCKDLLSWYLNDADVQLSVIKSLSLLALRVQVSNPNISFQVDHVVSWQGKIEKVVFPSLSNSLYEELTDIVSIIWNTEGFCGEVLGNAASMDYANLKKLSSMKQLRGKLENTSIGDWLCCFVVFGLLDRLHSQDYSSNSTTSNQSKKKEKGYHRWSVGGEQGEFSKKTHVKVEVTHRVLSSFLEKRAEDLDIACLLEYLKTIALLIEKLHKAKEFASSRELTQNEILTVGRLVNLSCGHNGVPNESEITKLKQVLFEADRRG